MDSPLGPGRSLSGVMKKSFSFRENVNKHESVVGDTCQRERVMHSDHVVTCSSEEGHRSVEILKMACSTSTCKHHLKTPHYDAPGQTIRKKLKVIQPIPGLRFVICKRPCAADPAGGGENQRFSRNRISGRMITNEAAERRAM